MKNLFFILVTLVVFTSCTKEDYGTPNVKSVKPTPVVDSDSIRTQLYDSLNFSITIPSINLDVRNLRPTSINELTDANKVYGFFISFIDNDGNLYEFKYKIDGDKFDKYGTGRVQGHTYIMSLDSETMNFCNWYQNVPFTYSLFGTTSLSKK